MAETSGSKAQPYQVVSRRYRPQAFVDLIGQPHITQALTNALTQNRVGHAYLFTGARGTGKTSTARIFAKCLNCQQGPTVTPCQECDSCLGIAAGDDLDVIEIDGASNRGIDEIRELRSNVGIRPSRSRYKIYIIDEVHMLTVPAFNALLKTLEEPPRHVKFFFCTTDPQKVPITVLSRCQRYDFMPVESAKIAACLARIAEAESVEADPAALELLARRAAGSLRDSQSLLEQLLAFCGGKVSLDDVLALLGIADSNRVISIGDALISRDVGRALREIEAAAQQGVDAGQLAQQIVGLCRDAIALKVGCDASLLLQTVGDAVPQLQALAERWSLDEWLAALQIVDQAVTKMQSSLYSRVLLEAACVRVCQLQQLQPIGALIGQIAPAAAGTVPGTPSQVTSLPPLTSERSANQKVVSAGEQSLAEEETSAKKKELPAPDVNEPIQHVAEADLADPQALWIRVAAQAGGLTRGFAQHVTGAQWADANLLSVTFNNDYSCQMCSRPERKQRLESLLCELTGRVIRVDFKSELAGPSDGMKAALPRANRQQQRVQIQQLPLVRAVIDLFDADVVDFQVAARGPEKREETEVIDEFAQESTEEISEHV